MPTIGRLASLLSLGLLLSLGGCSCETTHSPDALTDAGRPLDAPGLDAPGLDAPGLDARGVDTGSADAGATDAPRGDAGPPPPDLRITTCPGASLPSLASGEACEATAGDTNLLITADILTPGEVFRGGQVLVDGAGSIACVGCDCAATTGASTATRIVCPDAVLSPGLINAHEHLTFLGQPYTRTEERYEHRHDWRRGIRSHTRIPPRMATNTEAPHAELRMVMGGATSVNGSTTGWSMATQRGFLRNVDVTSSQEGLGQPAVDYDTFPLDDSGGTLRAEGCMYGADPTTAADIARREAYTPHIAEGIDDETRNEFACLREGAADLIQPQTALIHGVGLLPADIAEIARDGSMLVWSPRSNVTLYGDTARVTEYDRLGVPIAMGTDWVFTGSMNMLRELQCADELNATYMENHFTDQDLWAMATENGASAIGMDDVIGIIRRGWIADLALFDAHVAVDHRAVIDARPQDVLLVLRSGRPLYGRSALLAATAGGTDCETLEVCGSMQRVCAMRETGTSLATILANNSASYPLFFCGSPTNEPSCIPARTAAAAVVDGSNMYTGMGSAADVDGDGLPNAMDNCPGTFNAIRPLDHGAQSDIDADGLGDACDPCPLNAGTTMCTTPDASDRDGDTIPNARDNCPDRANTDQADADMDDKGDVCDPCPMASNPGPAVCPASIYTVQRGTSTGMVRVSGTVTALTSNGFYMQVASTATGYEGADYSGIFVFTSSAPGRMPGDVVDVSGTVGMYFGETQLTTPTVTVVRTGDPLPEPVVVTPAEVATGGTRARALQSVLVRVMTVSVTNIAPAPGGGETAPTYEFEVTGALRVDDLFHRISPFPMVGDSFASITGILAWRRSNSKLHPRAATDFVR